MPCILTRLFQNSVLGDVIYRLGHGKILKFKEDQPNYVPDERYLVSSSSSLDCPLKDDTDDHVIVDFDGEGDPEHPHNWPWIMKLMVGVSTALLSAFLYIGSIAYVSAKEDLMEEFGVSEVVAMLPLALYVFGYALGPMVFSPLSEHPKLGRNVFYASTALIFAILQIPSALVSNFAGFCVLRFLSGIFISPVIATGGSSFADIFTPAYVPHAMVCWGIGSYFGISVGPLIGAVLQLRSGGWRWSCWFLLITSSVFAIVFFTLVPETYVPTILYRKALRLRRVTGNHSIDVSGGGKHSESLKEILWRPIAIGFTEPVMMLVNVYIAMVYGVSYIWLEAFPIVFGEVKNFAPVPVGASYMSLFVGTIMGSMLYSALIWRHFSVPILHGAKTITAEMFMPTAIVGSVFMPTGIFILGWTVSRDIHWIVPMIGAAVYNISGIILFQSLLSYVGMSFPKYTASAFASNALVRSFGAGSFPLFGRALFKNLEIEKFPVAWGSTILGCISLLMVSIPVLFYFNGPKLRARSKYAGTGEEN